MQANRNQRKILLHFKVLPMKPLDVLKIRMRVLLVPNILCSINPKWVLFLIHVAELWLTDRVTVHSITNIWVSNISVSLLLSVSRIKLATQA